MGGVFLEIGTVSLFELNSLPKTVNQWKRILTAFMSPLVKDGKD